MKSSRVQACLTVLICASLACFALVFDETPAGGVTGAAVPDSLVAGTAGFGATALTADLQDADNFESFCSRHSNASLPPGCTPAQCARKSERHAERIASRSASVGC